MTTMVAPFAGRTSRPSETPIPKSSAFRRGSTMRLRLDHFLRLAAMPAILALVFMLLVTLSGHPAWSQAARTIKIVVAIPPGGAGDILARVLAQQIGRTQGLSMVIENRPGAANIIGTEAV